MKLNGIETEKEFSRAQIVAPIVGLLIGVGLVVGAVIMFINASRVYVPDMGDFGNNWFEATSRRNGLRFGGGVMAAFGVLFALIAISVITRVRKINNIVSNGEVATAVVLSVRQVVTGGRRSGIRQHNVVTVLFKNSHGVEVSADIINRLETDVVAMLQGSPNFEIRYLGGLVYIAKSEIEKMRTRNIDIARQILH